MYKILVIDDDIQLLRLLRDVFEIEGWRVVTCDSAEACIDAIKVSTFDICIIDLHLPDADGNALIEKLHSTLNIPIIAISGFENTIDLAATSQIGADYHMKKPFEPDEIVIECKRLIQKHRAVAEVADT